MRCSCQASGRRECASKLVGSQPARLASIEDGLRDVRAGQPVDLVDDDSVDPPRGDVGEQPLQGSRAFSGVGSKNASSWGSSASSANAVRLAWR
jgi:hypothetical protein